MSGIAEAEAHGVFLALAEGEVVVEGAAEALVEEAGIPLGVVAKLEVVENVKIDRDLLVGLVGDQLGESAGGQGQGDEGKQYFLHGK